MFPFKNLEKLNRFFFLLFLFIFISPSVFAESLLPRKIIALQDSELFPNYYFDPLHQEAEMVFNHLGLVVVPWNIHSGKLPEETDLADAVGVVSWYQKSNVVKNPEAYCSWLSRLLTLNKKILILGQFGFLPEKGGMPTQCEAFLNQFGIKYEGEFSDNPLFFEFAQKNSTLVEYERQLHHVDPLIYMKLTQTQPDLKLHLEIKRKDLKQSASAAVFTSPRGGFALDSYITYRNKAVNQSLWRLNPFLFFNEALGIQNTPRPDVTTKNGHRLFYSHVDGDGMVNVSRVFPGVYSSEVFYNEIIKKYSEWPITVSLITAYLDMPQYKNERVYSFYKNLASADNVEISSHTYSHPLSWTKKKLSFSISNYSMDGKKETVGSIEQLNSLLENMGVAKKVRLLQWSGDCLPESDTVKEMSQAGYLNINGGDTRFDQFFPSLTKVAPLGIYRGGAWQVYTSSSNENTYTNLWTGPFSGYSHVLETYANTESPVRLKPVNVYYHFYSAEKSASLNALKKVYETLFSEMKLFPIFTSEYAAMVNNFYNLEILIHEDGFKIKNASDLKTIRFDERQDSIDMSRSVGVLGFNSHQGSLYVHLDEKNEHEIYFSSESFKPYIKQATVDIQNLFIEEDQVSFQKKGWAKPSVTLAGLVPHKKYKIIEGSLAAEKESDEKGNLEIRFLKNEKNLSWTNVVLH